MSDTRHSRIVILLGALLALAFVCRPTQALQLVELNEDDLLVVEVGLENLDLSETLFIFQAPESTLVPLQGLVDTLDFPLNIDVAVGTVDGWFVNEKNTFSIDITSKTLFIRGEKQAWPKDLYYAVDDFDLYFDYRLLEQWFELHLNLNVSQLKLLISSELELPIVVYQKRLKKRESLSKEQSTSQVKNYHTNQYQMLGNPLFDLEFSDDLQNNRGHFKQFTSGVLQGRMDLLKHSMRSSYIFADGAEDLRLTFSRSASGPDADMGLGLKEYEVGDISTNSDSLLFGAIKGRGLSLGRETSVSLDKVDEVTLEGDAPPGWEVELYRNGSLVAFTDSGRDGRYVFPSIATFVGLNVFDIRIYGPQGQFRSRKEHINIGPGMIKQGEWGYQIYTLENNTRLVSLEDNSSSEPNSNFYSGEIRYGFNDYLTLQTSLIKLSPKGSPDAHLYSSFDAFSSLSGAFIHLKWVKDANSGNAYAALVKTKMGGLNFNLDVLKFNGLESDKNPGKLKKADIKIGVNGLTRGLFSTPMTYDFEIKDTEFRGSLKRQTSYINRLSFNLLSANIAHDLRYSTSSSDCGGDCSDDLSDNVLDANLSVNKRIARWRLKADLDYALVPTSRIKSFGSSASWKQNARFIYQTQLNYAFSDEDELSVNNSFTWNFDTLALSLNAGFTNNGSQSIGLSLNTAFGYDQHQKQFLVSKDSISSSGTARAKVYLDRNNNGEFNEGEPPVEGVVFKGRAAWRKQPTNAEGVAVLQGIPPKEMQLIEIDDSTLGDPFLRTPRASRYVFTHAGAFNYLEFAVQETLEIEGEVKIIRQGRSSIRSGIPVQLFNIEGELVAESSTEFDGIFIIEKVIPGKYQLKVAPAYLKRYHLSMSSPVPIHAKGGEGVVYLDSIGLEPIM